MSVLSQNILALWKRVFYVGLWNGCWFDSAYFLKIEIYRHSHPVTLAFLRKNVQNLLYLASFYLLLQATTWLYFSECCYARCKSFKNICNAIESTCCVDVCNKEAALFVKSQFFFINVKFWMKVHSVFDRCRYYIIIFRYDIEDRLKNTRKYLRKNRRKNGQNSYLNIFYLNYIRLLCSSSSSSNGCGQTIGWIQSK